MKKVKIIKNVPMPEPFRYPWHKLEIGESFPFTEGSTNQAHKRCREMSKKTGKLFRARTVGGKTSVWRVS